MNGSSYSATDELSLCQDRIISIFSLIKRNFKKIENKLLKESSMCQELILNVYKNSITRFFFLARKRKLISFQQLTFWHLIKSVIYEQFCLIKQVWASVDSLQFPTATPCRISAAPDVKACRIFARLGRQTLQNFCSI